MKLFVVGVGSPRIRCKQNAKPEGGPNLIHSSALLKQVHPVYTINARSGCREDFGRISSIDISSNPDRWDDPSGQTSFYAFDSAQ